MKGALIVIEGGDGAGKATQTELLVSALQDKGRAVTTLSFPNYTDNIFGSLIRECLQGERGDFLQVDPRVVSALYAADRFESKALITDALARGEVVVLDRYTTANMLHQGAKLTSEAEQRDLIKWIDRVEHEIYGLPRPDIVCYLEVEASVRARMVAEREGGKGDVAEENSAHQAHVDETARLIGSEYPAWRIIDCMEGSVVQPVEMVHTKVYNEVCDILDL